jgi:hypothetical protein
VWLSLLQLEIIHELAEGMKGCSTAFVAVALAGIALTVAASSGLPMEDAPEVRAAAAAAAAAKMPQRLHVSLLKGLQHAPEVLGTALLRLSSSSSSSSSSSGGYTSQLLHVWLL